MLDREQIVLTLTQQLDNVTKLAAFLEQEKQVLQQQNPDALTQITEQKAALLTAIQNTDQNIQQSQVFQQIKDEDDIKSLIDQTTVTLQQCQKQNLINGQVIQQSQMAVERMKTTILENHSRSSMTYDNKGKKSGGVSSLGLKA